MIKRKGIDKGAKKIDKIVTGFIIGGALASILGVSQTKKGKKVSKKIGKTVSNTTKKTVDTGVEYFGKGLIGIVKFFQKK